MPVKRADPLHDLVRSILLAAGASEFNAAGVAQYLVASNLRGVDTHGVLHVPEYVKRVREGAIRPAARPQVIQDQEKPARATETGEIWSRSCAVVSRRSSSRKRRWAAPGSERHAG